MEPQVINTFPLPAQTSDQKANYVQFKVERSDSVDVPGCTAIESLLLNGVEIPAFIDEKVPTDLTLRNFQPVRIPLYEIQDGPNGPMLVRSSKSNDGRWQVGSIVSIKGTFETPVTAKK